MTGPRTIVSLDYHHRALECIAAVLRAEGALQSMHVPLDLSRSRALVARVLGGQHPLVGRMARESYADSPRPGARLATLAMIAMYQLPDGPRRNSAMRGLKQLARESVERSVARSVRSTRPVAVIANQGVAGRAFRTAHDVGTIAVLNANNDVWGANAAIHSELAHETSAAARAELRTELNDTGEFHGLRDVRLADYLIVESERMRDRLVALGTNRDAITNLYNGVDIERWQPTPRDYHARPIRAVLVARIGRAKGVHHASEGAARSGVVERFTAVGGGVPATFRSRYPATHFTGRLQAEGVAEALARADVFVLPTLADCMARAVLEAMAAGVPVIVTPESGYEGVITDGVEGFIVPSRDPAAIAARLQQLSVDGELRRRMGLAARQLAERYSWEAYEERFREALNGPLAFLRGYPPRVER